MTNALALPQLPYAAEIERDPRLGSAHTRRAYRAALTRFENWRAGRALTETLVEEYMVLLRTEGLAPRSINHALACIRWWARRVAKLAGEYAQPEDAKRIGDLAARVVTVPDMKGTRSQTGRHMDDPEIIALLASCAADPTPIGTRDAALISVAYATGARIHEIKDLTLDDLTYTQDGNLDLVLHGKGDKDRAAYLYNGALDALNRWIDLRGATPGPVFNPIRKSGKILAGQGISLEGLRKVLVIRWKQAGIKAITWHDFRRTFIGKLLDAGTDLVTAQELAGHSSPTTTSAYDRRPERRKRQAVESATNLTLSLPKSYGEGDTK